MPVDLRHVRMSCVILMSSFSVVDESDELHQELTEDGQWAAGSDDGHDNQIHVDTEAQEVKDGSHSADTGNGSFCL